MQSSRTNGVGSFPLLKTCGAFPTVLCTRTSEIVAIWEHWPKQINVFSTFNIMESDIFVVLKIPWTQLEMFIRLSLLGL